MYPILFHFGGIEVETNLIIMFVGILVSGLYLERKVKRNMLSINFVDDYFGKLIAIFLLAGRFGSIFLNLNIYKSNPLSVLYFWDGNFSMYLGLIGLGIAFLILCIVKKEKFSKWLDIFLMPFLLFVMFTSLGNFAKGIDYGAPSSLPFAITFNIPEVRYTVPVHPVQIYEFIGLVIIFLYILNFSKKKRLVGITSFFGLSLFFALELFLEFFRASPDTLIYGIKFHMLLFGSLFAISLIGLILKSHRDFEII